MGAASTPNAPHPTLAPRQRFLRERQQRQNAAFATIGIAMIMAAVAAALVFTGIVSVPFDNDFSVKVECAETGGIPCPRVDAKPMAPSQVTITVINITQHQGLASKATDMLSATGLQIEEPANSGVGYTNKVRIAARVDSVDTAYPVTRFFPGSHVHLSDAEDATVTVELGTFYGDTVSAEDVQRVLKPNDSIEQPAKYRPMSSMKQD